MLKPAVMEIMDTAPSPVIKDKVEEIVKQVEGVLFVDKCLVRKMGFDYFVDIHLIVKGTISVHDGHLIAHRAKNHLMESLPRIVDVLIHIEPNYLETNKNTNDK